MEHKIVPKPFPEDSQKTRNGNSISLRKKPLPGRNMSMNTWGTSNCKVHFSNPACATSIRLQAHNGAPDCSMMPRSTLKADKSLKKVLSEGEPDNNHEPGTVAGLRASAIGYINI